MITTGHFAVTDGMRARINRVLDSGRISYGDESKEFENRFAKLHGSRYGVLSNSGTSSLHVALQALKEVHHWQDGDEVIIPATTFVATANIVLHCRLTPVLVDVEKHTFGMDSNSLYFKITSRSRCIIPVHIGGQPCNMTAIMQIARYKNLAVIEDSCECMFATRHGESVGNIGSIGCFSMYVAHLLVTGVGGIATTNDILYARKMRSLVNHGLSFDNLNLNDDEQPQPMLNRSFVFTSIGHSFRITEFEAALANAQLDDWQTAIKIRQSNAHLLTSLLDDLQEELILPQVAGGNSHSWMFYTLQTRKEEKHDLMCYLNAHDIETRDLPSLLYQPCYDWDADQYPVSKHLATHAFYVGCAPHITESDIHELANTIHAYYDR